MELKKIAERLTALTREKKLVRLALILGIAGILLIYLSTWTGSGGTREQPAAQTVETAAGEYQRQLEESLARVVRAVTGEDKPEVMITLKNNGRAVYAADDRQRGEEAERTHVIVEDGEGGQDGLTVVDMEPEIRGVVIVSRYGGDPGVKEKLVNAARAVLGVSGNRVCVVDGSG